jgi:hypothetical protein
VSEASFTPFCLTLSFLRRDLDSLVHSELVFALCFAVFASFALALRALLAFGPALPVVVLATVLTKRFI